MLRAPWVRKLQFENDIDLLQGMSNTSEYPSSAESGYVVCNPLQGNNSPPARAPIYRICCGLGPNGGPLIYKANHKLYELMGSPSLDYEYRFETGRCTVTFYEGEAEDSDDESSVEPEKHDHEPGSLDLYQRDNGVYVEVRQCQLTYSTGNLYLPYRVPRVMETTYFPLPQRIKWEFRPYGFPNWLPSGNLSGVSIAPRLALFAEHGFKIVGVIEGLKSGKTEINRLGKDSDVVFQEYELKWFAIQKL